VGRSDRGAVGDVAPAEGVDAGRDVDAGGVLGLGVAVRLGCGAVLGFGAWVGCGVGDGLGWSGVRVGGSPGFSRPPPSSKRQPIEPPFGTDRPPAPLVAYFHEEEEPSDQNRPQ
jgi:hypothetical protein